MTTRVEQIPERNASQLSRGMVVLFAFSCGATVANLYYAQPILDTLARAFGTGSGAAGLVVTFAQIGYALGAASSCPSCSSSPRLAWRRRRSRPPSAC
jgi:predicted MFS family arabinose efflux permease